MRHSNLQFLLFVVTAVSLSLTFAQQKPPQNLQSEIIPDETEQFEFTGDRRVNLANDVPAALYNPNYQLRPDSPELMARQYLQENASALHLKPDLSDLQYKSTRETPGGYRIRFEQFMGRYRVHKSTITVSINRQNRVVFVMNGYKVPYGPESTKPVNLSLSVTNSQAMQTAKTHLGIAGMTRSEKTEPVVYYARGNFRLAQKVNFIALSEKQGDWEVMVDGQTGQVFRVEDIARYDGPRGNNAINAVQGSGSVYDPDPITTARTYYHAPWYADNDNGDNDSLTAQQFIRPLRDITLETGTGKYLLIGPYACIVDYELPITGIFPNDSGNFYYTRSKLNFEAVMCYYHIDNSMRYVNDTLGYHVMPLQYAGGVHFDPHGLNGDANAHETSDGYVAFGSPPHDVDNGEDAKTILHELLHGLHDWITDLNFSQTEGLGEGSADYWAQSYSRNLHYFAPADPQYDWLFTWGANGGATNLRVTDWPDHYPEGANKEIHIAGQMWSSSLMSIFDVIGRDATDRDILEALSMTDVNATQRDGALAFIQADRDLFGGAHLATIVQVFTARGYIAKPVMARFVADVTGGPGPLTVNFKDRSFSYPGTITSWQWDFNGDGVSEATTQNPTYVFTGSGLYSIRLVASDGATVDTLVLPDLISVNQGVLVWDGLRKTGDYSGGYIDSLFKAHKTGSVYSRSPDLPTSLIGYDAVFASTGSCDAGFTTITELEGVHATTFKSYLKSGGKLYLEGAAAIVWDLWIDAELMTLLGVNGVSLPGLPDFNLYGQPQSVGEGMRFTQTTQAFRNYTEFYGLGATARASFIQPSRGNAAIQSVGTYGQRTVCFSYPLARLVDANPPSTREDLLANIVRFFGLPGPKLWPNRATVDFGYLEVGTPDTFAVVLSNVGTDLLTIDALSMRYANYALIDVPTLPAAIVPRGTLPLRLVFHPTGKGVVTDTLRIESSDPMNPVFLVPVIGNGFTIAPARAGLLYAMTGTADSGRVYKVDPANGATTLIGRTDVAQITGARVHPTSGEILGLAPWGSTTPLVRIDAEGGRAQPLTTVSLGFCKGMTFKGDTLIVGYSYALYRVNQVTGTATLIKSYSGKYFSGLAVRPGTNELWVTLKPLNAYADTLYTIDLGTLTMSAVGALGIKPVRDIIFDAAGTLYGVVGADTTISTLVRINTSTGAATTIGEMGVKGVLALAGTDVFVSAGHEPAIVPAAFALEQNYPNPFNPKTVVRYQLPEVSDVKLIVYDLLGRAVAVLVNERKPAGRHSATFDASGLTSGVYFYRLETGGHTATRKLVVLK